MTTTRILFLDDDKTRHVRFMQALIGKSIDATFVWTAQEAIAQLVKHLFDEVHLDHDLGGEPSHMTLPDSGSGYDVAVFIASMPKSQRPKKAVLHSFNPAGRLRMRDALAGTEVDVVIKPFDF